MKTKSLNYLGHLVVLCGSKDLSLLLPCLSLTAPSAPSAGSVHLRLPDTSGLLAPTAGSDTRESSLAGAGLTGAMLVSPQPSVLSVLPHCLTIVVRTVVTFLNKMKTYLVFLIL